jgi:hypothetical protein
MKWLNERPKQLAFVEKQEMTKNFFSLIGQPDKAHWQKSASL